MKYVSMVLISLFFVACGGSPKNSYGVKTQDYGQCRSVKQGEKIIYKTKFVRYVCENEQVLYDEPYEKNDEWYFKSGVIEKEKIKSTSPTKVVKILRKECDFDGAYGTGTKKIRKFYFNAKFNACKPFDWSGEAGIVPFDSFDECRVECFNFR